MEIKQALSNIGIVHWAIIVGLWFAMTIFLLGVEA